MQSALTAWLLIGLICLSAPVAVEAAAVRPAPANTGQAGGARDVSLYVPAGDGVKIAIDVWLPKDLPAGQRIPALMKGTPYWRAPEFTALGKKMAGSPPVEADVKALNERGYAVVGIDARGTGASFGAIRIMFSDAEISDYGAVADWITAQPWSNGKVGAYGFSYRGMTAANIASLPNPSIKAVAPLFDISDLYLLAYPGGAFEQYLLSTWSAQTHLLNSGVEACNGDKGCEQVVRGPKPVDADIGGPGDHAMLKAAIAEHAGNYNVHDCVRAAPARDDPVCDSGRSLGEVSVLARKQAIERRSLPMFVLTGWLDESSPEQALFRYNTFSNPQEVVIGPFTHGGFMGDDPFAPDRPLDMPYLKQTALMADFFDRYLKDGPQRPITPGVHYYVNGPGTWRSSSVWPPADAKTSRWYLGPSKSLVRSAPTGAGVDRYAVDFNATTGTLSGYRGQVDLSKTDYGDRRAADARLLTYDSAPLEADMEIAGSPVAHLRLASSAPDGLAIVYLEDVGPDGRVTYVSQGVLRLAFRKRAVDDSGYSADPFHDYRRADLRSMTPGASEDMVIGLSPIAALIGKGHRLRLAVAGADAGNLERLPKTGEDVFSVASGHLSYLELSTIQN